MKISVQRITSNGVSAPVGEYYTAGSDSATEGTFIWVQGPESSERTWRTTTQTGGVKGMDPEMSQTRPCSKL